MKSMTGYGQSVVEKEGFNLKVEARSYNHRFCEITIRMPKQLLFLEEKMKKIVQQYVKRGKVDIFVTTSGTGWMKKDVQIDWDLLEEYLQISGQIAQKTNLCTNLSVKDFLFHEQFVAIEEVMIPDEEFVELFVQATKKAMEELTEMRSLEGKALEADLRRRIQKIADIVHEIKAYAPYVMEIYREKLKKRVQEFLTNVYEADENRLLTEVAIFAEKANIDEELTRLKSHIDQFLKTMDDGEVVGRKLDFIVQEMNREANTIGSKANDVKISHFVVELKSEIEKIKEQVQNIE